MSGESNPNEMNNDDYEEASFHPLDWVVFVGVLCVSAAIGLYHGCSGGKQRTTQEFLMANRSLSAVPVALSVLASFFSASTLLGTPAEVYLRGIEYWMAVWGAMLAPCIGAYMFGPMFHRMKVVSVNEYLEKRYKSRAVRSFGAALFIIKATLGMGIVMFGPAVALNEVTGWPVWSIILLLGIVCTFYTAIGGMKAVIWTDVFQICVMMAGILAAIIQGTILVGGLDKVWQVSDEGGRILFFDFDPNPTTRHTFWTLVIGSIFVWLPPYTVDQQMIQRFAATKSLKQAVVSLLLNVPGMFIIITLCSFTGLVMYAYYALMECDPLAAGIVTDPNQLMPRFVLDIFYDMPGVPGLFVASLFSGALRGEIDFKEMISLWRLVVASFYINLNVTRRLSYCLRHGESFDSDAEGRERRKDFYLSFTPSISSMLNSLAAITWEDYCRLCACHKNLSEMQATSLNKLFSVAYAVLGVIMGMVFSTVGGTVLQMSIAFNGAAGAPLVGIFILGAFFPWANAKGALVGGVLGFCFPMWISIGAYVTKPDVMENLNTTTAGCPNSTLETNLWLESENTSLSEYADHYSSDASSSLETTLYSLSYLWYTAAGIIVTVVIGIIVSFITGSTDPKSIDPRLLLSYADKLWCCCGEGCKEPLRCGVDYEAAYSSDEEEDTEEKVVIGNQEESNGQNIATTKLDAESATNLPSHVDKSNIGSYAYNNAAYDKIGDVRNAALQNGVTEKRSYGSSKNKSSEFILTHL